MLSYLNMIRDLERVHGQNAFNFYDKNFRAHRQTQPLTWGALHHELWIRATTMTGAPSLRTSVQGKFCYKYNKPQGCNVRDCPYDHVCGHCRKNHPQYKCFVKQRSMNASTAKFTNSAPLSQSSTNKNAVKDNHSFRANTSKK